MWLFSCSLLPHSTEGTRLILGVPSIVVSRAEVIQSGPKKCIHSLLINIFGINLNEISVSG